MYKYLGNVPMGHGDERVCADVRAGLTALGFDPSEAEIQNATKFTVRSKGVSGSLNVYNTGKVNVEGKQGELRDWLLSFKMAIENGSGPAVLLPVEIEKFPETLLERVPDCDPVIHWFFAESLSCYKVNSMAGAMFMLGAASEKAIHLLIERYGNAITDETKKDKYFTKVNNRMISKKFEAFLASYQGCKSKPDGLPFGQDLDQYLTNAFHFYRASRNEVGHPQIIPDLDKGVTLANIGQFIVYAERIYALIVHLEKEGVEV